MVMAALFQEDNMQYYAKTYTADPKTGLLTPGEYLTEAQVSALGEEKIAGMVARGILAAAGEKTAKTEKPVKSDKPVAKRTAKKVKPAAEEADTEEEDTAFAEPETEEELPELDAAEAIGDEEKTAASAKKGGRRKSK